MTSHLPSAVSDLLEAGLSFGEMAELMGIADDEVAAILRVEEPKSLTYGGAIRLSKLTYLLWELRRTLSDDEERARMLREEALKIGGRDEEERFGVSMELIRAVITEHGGIIRAGCYVPARAEVALKEPEWLYSVLTDWFWESPTDLIPIDAQIEDVLRILRSRRDAKHPLIQRIIEQAPLKSQADG